MGVHVLSSFLTWSFEELYNLDFDATSRDYNRDDMYVWLYTATYSIVPTRVNMEIPNRWQVVKP